MEKGTSEKVVKCLPTGPNEIYFSFFSKGMAKSTVSRNGSNRSPKNISTLFKGRPTSIYTSLILGKFWKIYLND